MFLTPMLARSAEESHLTEKEWYGWTIEPKHDGMRAIIERTEDGVEIYSRSGKSQKGKCPHLEESLMSLPIGTVLDGEIALIVDIVEVAGKTVPVVDFNKTMRIMGSGAAKAVLRQKEFGKVSFLIFDVTKHGDLRLESVRQSIRSKIADKIILDGVVHNPRYTDDFKGIYDKLVAAGVEGAILKHSDGVYENSRSKFWLKVKSVKTYDVVVSGFTEGAGKYTGQVGAIEFSAYMPDGTLKYVGRCSGMDDATRKLWTTISTSYDAIDDIIIEIKANELVGSGEYRTPRHPQYLHIRTDRTPESCLMEQFKA